MPGLWYAVADAKGVPVNDAGRKVPIVVPTDARTASFPTALPARSAAAKVVPLTLRRELDQGGITKDDKGIETYQYHESAKSVIAPHGTGYVIIQACVAILILVGFESVTSMGEEAKNAKRDIPRACHPVARHSRRLLLSVRVFRRQLLS